MASFPSQSRGSSNCVRTRFSSLTVEPLMAASRWLHSDTDGETQQRPIPTGFLRDMGFLGDASWLNPPLSTVSDDSGPFRQTIRSDSIHSFGIVWIGCADGRGWTLLDSLPGILGCDALPPPPAGGRTGIPRRLEKLSAPVDGTPTPNLHPHLFQFRSVINISARADAFRRPTNGK